jgi:hypothetical protein
VCPLPMRIVFVVPDILGTTIKLTSSASWGSPLAWRQRTTASGAGAVTYIGPTVVTCPEIRWPPGSDLADRLPVVTASRGLGGRLRNVSAAGVSQRPQARLPNRGVCQLRRPWTRPYPDQVVLRAVGPATGSASGGRPTSGPAPWWSGCSADVRRPRSLARRGPSSRDILDGSSMWPELAG